MREIVCEREHKTEKKERPKTSSRHAQTQVAQEEFYGFDILRVFFRLSTKIWFNKITPNNIFRKELHKHKTHTR